MRVTPNVAALAAAALFAFAVASAQVTRTQAPQQPSTSQPGQPAMVNPAVRVQPQSSPSTTGQTAAVNPNVPVPPTYAELQQQNQTLTAQMTVLREQIMTMRNQSATLQQQNAELRQQITEMTSRGGSQVRAFCAFPILSRNTAGGHTACRPYLCEDVSGLCRDRCTTTDQCAPGYVCNNNTCVDPF